MLIQICPDVYQFLCLLLFLDSLLLFLGFNFLLLQVQPLVVLSVCVSE